MQPHGILEEGKALTDHPHNPSPPQPWGRALDSTFQLKGPQPNNVHCIARNRVGLWTTPFPDMITPFSGGKRGPSMPGEVPPGS